MSEQITRTLIDDLDGSKAAETVRFSYDETLYEIDLSKRNLAAFQKTFAPFIAHARRTQNHKRTVKPARTTAQRGRSQEIRRWAREQGIQVSERGRIPADIVNQYLDQQ